jgi:hypothetical protein
VYKKLVVLASIFCFGAGASIVEPINPTDMAELNAYLGDTTYIDFSALTEFDYNTFGPMYGSVGDGNVTLTFSGTGAKFTVPDTWGPFWAGGDMVTPPYPEGFCIGGFCSQFDGSVPLPVLFGFFDSSHPLTIALSGSPVDKFGLEVGSFIGSVTATFYGTSSTLPITVNSPEQHQSRIVAADFDGEEILQVVLTTTDDWGPAVGAFRYEESPVPEPMTGILLGVGLLAMGAIRRIRRAA